MAILAILTPSRPISSLHSPFALRTSASLDPHFIGVSEREFALEGGRQKAEQTIGLSGLHHAKWQAKPLLDNFKLTLGDWAVILLPKNPLGTAVAYTRKL